MKLDGCNEHNEHDRCQAHEVFNKAEGVCQTNSPLVTLALNKQVRSLACKVSLNNQIELAKWLQLS